MRQGFQLLLVYHERLPRLVQEHGFSQLALGELRAIASSPMEIEIDSKAVPLTARLLSADEAADAGFSWHRDEYHREHLALFEGVVDFDMEALADSLRDQNHHFSATFLKETARSAIGTDLEKLAGDIILASAIAVPGALHPSEIQYIVDGIVAEGKRLYPSIVADARAEFAEVSWPQIVDLPVSSAIIWLRRIPGFEEGVPSGFLGRAVSALSHLLGYEPEATGSELMWTMVGLEALYIRGREGLTEQLREKVKAILGVPETHGKRFTALYSYRSKFVHGGLDVPLAYTPYDAADSFMRSELNTFHSSLTGTIILIATLQRMLMQNRLELDFRWTLDPE